eukprot:m.97193 g.97193  ORF g.97193 m.97193 type:complete len:99 (+) comp20510_c0_seq1:58-354(+)
MGSCMHGADRQPQPQRRQHTSVEPGRQVILAVLGAFIVLFLITRHTRSHLVVARQGVASAVPPGLSPADCCPGELSRTGSTARTRCSKWSRREPFLDG